MYRRPGGQPPWRRPPHASPAKDTEGLPGCHPRSAPKLEAGSVSITSFTATSRVGHSCQCASTQLPSGSWSSHRHLHPTLAPFESWVPPGLAACSASAFATGCGGLTPPGAGAASPSFPSPSTLPACRTWLERVHSLRNPASKEPGGGFASRLLASAFAPALVQAVPEHPNAVLSKP